MKEKKKSNKIWLKIMSLAIVGSLGTALVQNGTFNIENPVNRVVRGLRESELEVGEVMELDCSEFSCIGVKGVYIEIPELGSSQGVWIYHYADKSIVKQSIEHYNIVNTIPNIPHIKIYGNGNYFITATTLVTDEQFNKVIEVFEQSLKEKE